MPIARWGLALTLACTLVACGDPLAEQGSSRASANALVVLSADDDGSQVDLAFGDSVVIDDLGVPMDDVYVESDDTAIAYPVQPSDGQGTAGFVAVGEGATRVTVWESFPTGKAQVPVVTVRVVVGERRDPGSS